MKKIHLMLILLTLTFALIFTSCNGELCSHKDEDNNLVCDTCGEALPDPNLDGKIIYKITVIDANGEACPNIIVELYSGEKKIATKMTNTEGIVKCSEEHPVKAEKDPFTVKLISPDGKTLTYDEAKAVIADGAEEITLQLFRSGADLPAEHLSFNGGEESSPAPIMTDGKYMIDFKAGGNYFVFYPSVRGQYKISVSGFTEGVSSTIGYFGSPHFVQSQNVASVDGTGEVFIKDGDLFLNIRAFNVGEDYYSSSRYVLRVDTTADATAFIEIKCVDKNLPLSKEELPWEDCILPADPAPFVPDFSVDSAEELTPVPLTDPDFKAVFNENDGFYHVGTADGPVIFVKLSVDSEYLASFKKMMETTQFCGYVYDDNGNLLAKKNYHGMMEKYITAAGDFGVYPLTPYLKDAITTIGNAWGWYKDGANNIFTGIVMSPVVPENAYLFACCYYEED